MPKKPAKKPATDKQTKKLSAEVVKKPIKNIRGRVRNYLSRRPHRSFQMTKRRDYKRSLKLPSYWSFTGYVFKTLRQNWKLFGGLSLVYVAALVIITGTNLTEVYNGLKDLLDTTKGNLFEGTLGGVSQAGLLLAATVASGLSPDLSSPQSILSGLSIFFVWLATIWLLRNVLAGHTPRLRDGLYNSGAPVLATVTVGFIVLLQMIPAAIASIVYAAAETSGLLTSGIGGMLAWTSIILLTMISIYWVTGSLIALVVVTLPGMYPIRAIRAAGDLVVGRRLRVLLRVMWMLLVIAFIWAVIMIPVILFDDWFKQTVGSLSWLPIVPIISMILSSVTMIFVSAYVYLLYRRIVDDDAGPA